MSPSPPEDLTGLLLDWSSGQLPARDRLIALVYDELRVLADRSLRREASDHTLQPTALVNEVYLKMVDQRRVRWKDRAHFFAVAATVMRRILVDHARRVHAVKRGHGVTLLPMEASDIMAAEPVFDVVALHDALDRLGAMDERQGQIVELRFFGGLTIEETAEVLGISPATVKNDWTLARAWLHRDLSPVRSRPS